jgi:hypothetical protein
MENIKWDRTVDCKVSGGDLPKDFKAEIKVKLDFSGFKNDDLQVTVVKLLDLLAMASSPRVQLQNGVLRKFTAEQLTRIAKEGYSCKVDDLVTGKVRVPKIVDIATMKTTAMKMSLEDRLALIESLKAM